MDQLLMNNSYIPQINQNKIYIKLNLQDSK